MYTFFKRVRLWLKQLTEITMTKRLLIMSMACASAAIMLGAVPEGNMYLLTPDATTPGADNELTLQERSEDDIEEGFWRYLNDDFTIGSESGTLTLSDASGAFILGFDSENEFGIDNNLTETQNMVYLRQDGEPVNYELTPGSYTASLICMEDLYGDMGGDSWILQLKANFSTDESQTLYIVGFNGCTEASGAYIFSSETADNGLFTYAKFPMESCSEGFRIYDSSTETWLGADTSFGEGEINADNPIAILKADGEAVKCSLEPGYYTVNLSMTGAMSMISFMRCDDQTPADEAEYYVTGINGNTTPSEAYRMTRTETEEEGEITVMYELHGVEITDAVEGVKVTTADGSFSFGLNPDYSAMIGDTLTAEMPLAFMSLNGKAVGYALPASTYDVTFSINGLTEGMLSLTDSASVEQIDDAESQTAVYYDMQGRRVTHPSAGLYIEKKGSKVTKKMIR